MDSRLGALIPALSTISVTLSWDWNHPNFSEVAGAMETPDLFLISHPNPCCSSSQKGACSAATGDREQSCCLSATIPASRGSGLSLSARTDECRCLRSEGGVMV